MASEAAYRLKYDWMEMPVESFEPLTFGKLKIGQKFIVFPFPNDGHGGFKGTHYIFTKDISGINKKTLSGKRNIRLPGGAISGKGIRYSFLDSTPVILVE